MEYVDFPQSKSHLEQQPKHPPSGPFIQIIVQPAPTKNPHPVILSKCQSVKMKKGVITTLQSHLLLGR